MKRSILSYTPPGISQPRSAIRGSSFIKRLAGQGALLTGGLVLGQLFAFGRNAILGHILSKGDFGIAASLAVTLQILESVSDMAADRMIVQASDGDEARVVNAAHSILMVRGLLMGLVLWLGAPIIAALFHVDAAAGAFRWIAAIMVIKGFLHLDLRRFQRKYQNFPAALIEVVPQAISFAIAYPIARSIGSYEAIIWLSVLQALATVIVSHAIAERRWNVSFEAATLERFLAFGWPVLLSALPMIAVYQFDRIITAHFLGLETLAAYTAAFMITMAPGTIIVKVANSLALPLLAETKADAHRFARRFAFTAETLVLAASLYLAGFIIAGGPLVQMAFGPNYAGLDTLTGLLAGVWSLRILALVAGTALMAHGDTRPILTAVTIRSTTLVLALFAAMGGYGVNAIAACGILGELLSLAYLSWRIGRLGAGLSKLYLARAMLVPLVALTATLAAGVVPGSLLGSMTSALAVSLVVLGAGVSVMPAVRGRVRQELRLDTPAFAG